MIVWIAHAKVGNRRDLIPKTPNLSRLGVLLSNLAFQLTFAFMSIASGCPAPLRGPLGLLADRQPLF